MKKHIPNLLTLCNSLCGGLAIMFILQGRIETACWLVILGALIDFFDGFIARALKVTSEIGKQLDSLSDVITFGVVPALLALYLFKVAFAPTPMGKNTYDILHRFNYWQLVPLLMIPFSAYRLGKFNIDTRQTTSFLGLPTPANAIFWVGLSLSQIYQPQPLLMQPAVILILSLLFSLLLVSEIPLFAMKFKTFGWKGNEVKFIFLGLSLLLLVSLRFLALPLIIVLYIVLSIIHNFVSRNHELHS